jgi:hypothetical protein
LKIDSLTANPFVAWHRAAAVAVVKQARPTNEFQPYREILKCRNSGKREVMTKSYVIEVGDDQAGLVIREDGERDFLFHAALDQYSALEGRRFANAFLAERAAVAHASSRRRRRSSASSAGAFAP